MRPRRHFVFGMGLALLGVLLLAGSQVARAAERTSVLDTGAAVPAQQTASPGLSQAPLPCGATQTITYADNGRTFFFPVGSRFLLHLKRGYTWTVQVSNPDVLTRVCSVDQGVYEASAQGQTTLSATGYPQCSTPVCPQYVLFFQITVQVGFPPSSQPPAAVTSS